MPVEINATKKWRTHSVPFFLTKTVDFKLAYDSPSNPILNIKTSK